MISNQQTLLLALASVLVLSISAIDCDRQNRRISNDYTRGFKSKCGSSTEVARKIGECWMPIFDIIEGKVPEPRDDAESIIICDRFNATEKCTRIVAKDCLSGFQKTVVSAVAAATKRFRTSECKNEATRFSYRAPVRCLNKKGPRLAAVFKNHTAMVQAIRDQPNLTPEEKIQKVCCLFNALDRDMESVLNPECPDNTQTIVNIVHSITEDAKNTLCLRPKCEHAVDAFLRSQHKPPQTYIEPLMMILFMVNNTE